MLEAIKIQHDLERQIAQHSRPRYPKVANHSLRVTQTFLQGYILKDLLRVVERQKFVTLNIESLSVCHYVGSLAL